MKILIIKLNGINNIMLTMPLVRALKYKYENAEIHYLTLPSHVTYVESIPEIAKVFSSQGDSMPLVLNLLKEKYVYIFDLEKNAKSAFVCYNLKQQFNSSVKVFSYPKNILHKLLFKNKIQKCTTLSTKYIKSAACLQLENDGKGLQYILPDDVKLKEGDLPVAHLGGFLVINILSFAADKQNYIEEIVKSLHFPIILIGEKNNASFAEKIKEIDPIRIYNACGKFSEAETYAILQRSKMVITGNDKWAYLAVATQKPIINIDKTLLKIDDVFPYSQNNKQYILQDNNSFSAANCVENAQKWLKN